MSTPAGRAVAVRDPLARHHQLEHDSLAQTRSGDGRLAEPYARQQAVDAAHDDRAVYRRR